MIQLKRSKRYDSETYWLNERNIISVRETCNQWRIMMTHGPELRFPKCDANKFELQTLGINEPENE